MTFHSNRNEGWNGHSLFGRFESHSGAPYPPTSSSTLPFRRLVALELSRVNYVARETSRVCRAPSADFFTFLSLP